MASFLINLIKGREKPTQEEKEKEKEEKIIILKDQNSAIRWKLESSEREKTRLRTENEKVKEEKEKLEEKVRKLQHEIR